MTDRTFSFGANWRRYLKTLDEGRIETARRSLADFLGLDSLKDMTFLDVGCGSGLFSYCAHALGAERVVSFDADPESVECCRYLRSKAGNPKSWEIMKGSVLDADFIDGLGAFDIVYAWGVLHHTGNMKKAVGNTVSAVAADGLLYLALYNRTGGVAGSETWLKVKRTYSRMPVPGKRLMEGGYIFLFVMSNLIKLRNPVKRIKNHRSMRGMNWFTDLRDWLGGYPYEFASAGEILELVEALRPSLEPVKVVEEEGYGCNEFLFKNTDRNRKE